LVVTILICGCYALMDVPEGEIQQDGPSNNQLMSPERHDDRESGVFSVLDQLEGEIQPEGPSDRWARRGPTPWGPFPPGTFGHLSHQDQPKGEIQQKGPSDREEIAWKSCTSTTTGKSIKCCGRCGPSWFDTQNWCYIIDNRYNMDQCVKWVTNWDYCTC